MNSKQGNDCSLKRRVMKRLISAALLLTALLTFQSENLQAAAKHPPVSVSFQIFYNELSPYGRWVDYPGYGYGWIPAAGTGFVPYGSNGQWVYTDLGWTWTSYYSWGWAPFHYGRWIYDGYYGWVWMPDYTWAPSWCVWGYYDGYYGWAPMAPGVYYSSGYRPPASCWTFVPQQHITQVNVYNYHVRNNTTIYNNVTVVNNSGTYNDQKYFSGPRAEEVTQRTGKPVTRHNISASNKPGQTVVRGNELTIYRPNIEKSTERTVAPANARRLENVKPVNVESRSDNPTKNVQPNTNGKAAPQRVSPNNNNQRGMPEKNVAPQRTTPAPQQRENIQRRDIEQRNVTPQRVNPGMEQRNVNPQRENQLPQRTAPPQRETPPVQQRNVPPQQNNPPQQRSVPQMQPQRMQEPPQPRGKPEMQQRQFQPQPQPRQFNSQSPSPQPVQPRPGGGGAAAGGRRPGG